MKEYETYSPGETYRIGRELGKEAKPGQVYTLTGDLGVGKTVFTQGFADGLGVREQVNSPTFTILQIYESGRLPLYHFDVYRIGDPEEMYEVGWEDYVWSDGVCLIEWADLIGELTEEIPPEKLTEVRIEKDPARGFDYRKLLIR
jgi:tRNA threonylcarbamoyladenosine biosynthesis protein TsaE